MNWLNVEVNIMVSVYYIHFNHIFSEPIKVYMKFRTRSIEERGTKFDLL